MAFTPKLQLTSLTLTAFRNHASTRVEPGAALIALCGHNGAGKTNVLEAISLLMPGRGLRGAPYEDLVCASTAADRGWAVSAVVENDGLETRIGTGFEPRPAVDGELAPVGGASREVRIEGQAQRSAGALAVILQETTCNFPDTTFLNSTKPTSWDWAKSGCAPWRSSCLPI